MSGRQITRVAPLRAAAAACGVLGLASVIFGVVEATQTHLSRLVVGGGTAIVMWAYGAGLLLAGYGVLRASRFARGPAIALALIQLPVAWSFLRGEPGPLLSAVGVSLAAVSLVVIVCLVLPASTRAFFAERRRAEG